MKSVFPESVWAAATAHALVESPNESCGLVVSGEYIPCKNVAEFPRTEFAISEKKVAKARKGLQGVIHSHPDGVKSPSEADMKYQIGTNKPWGVVVLLNGTYRSRFEWGDHLLHEPLLGRVWVPGVFDCFSLVRSYMLKAKQIKIADLPRTDDWAGLDTTATFKAHRDNYPMFDEIPFKSGVELLEGDLLILALMSSTPNHFAIYVGNNLILHHPSEGLSSRRPLNTLAAKIVHILRLKEQAHD